MPTEDFLDIMSICFDDDEEPRPPDDDRFEYVRISYGYEWPCNPQDDDMETFLPANVLAFGETPKTFDCFYIDPIHESEALRILRDQRRTAERNDPLLRMHGGNWEYEKG